MHNNTHPNPRVGRIRSSYDALETGAAGLVERFYAMLFDRHPDIRPLFPKEMARQAQHLQAAIALVVRNLDRLDILEEPLKQLGARHAAYGVRSEHYKIVRDTMLDALAATAGPAWTPQLAADWRHALEEVSAAMLRGAAEVAYEAARIIAGTPATSPISLARPNAKT